MQKICALFSGVEHEPMTINEIIKEGEAMLDSAEPVEAQAVLKLLVNLGKSSN